MTAPTIMLAAGVALTVAGVYALLGFGAALLAAGLVLIGLAVAVSVAVERRRPVAATK